MIEVIKQPADFAFVGNPIVFKLNTGTSNAVTVTVKPNAVDSQAFEFIPISIDGQYSVEFDIADILKAYLTDYIIGASDPILNDVSGFVLDYRVIANNGGADVTISEKKAFRGGLGNDLYIWLAKHGFDIFFLRFLSNERQIFLTTRTNGYHLVMKESELYPLLYIAPEADIVFTSPAGNVLTLVHHGAGQKIKSLDIAAIRKYFFMTHGEFVSFFTVKIGSVHAVNITIEPNTVTDISYLFQFRNSLGMDERVELTGVATHTPEFSDESVSWQRHNQHGIMEDDRDRIPVRKTMTFEAGYQDVDRLHYILDMVSSELVYRVYPDGTLTRYIPSAENPTITNNGTTPGSITITMKAIYEDTYYSPSGIDFARPETILGGEDGSIVTTEDNNVIILD